MKRKIYLYSLILLSFSVFNVTFARIIGDPMPNEYKPKKEERKVLIEEKKIQIQERVCERVQKRVETRIGIASQRMNHQSEKFDSMILRLEDILLAMEKYDIDLSILKGHIEEFRSLVDAYMIDYSDFVYALRTAYDNSCVEDSEKYKGTLSEAKIALESLRISRKEVISFYSEVIRQDIVSLRQQISALNSSEISDTPEQVTEESEE